jgi:hypothetical protein
MVTGQGEDISHPHPRRRYFSDLGNAGRYIRTSLRRGRAIPKDRGVAGTITGMYVDEAGCGLLRDPDDDSLVVPGLVVTAVGAYPTNANMPPPPTFPEVLPNDNDRLSGVCGFGLDLLDVRRRTRG